MLRCGRQIAGRIVHCCCRRLRMEWYRFNNYGSIRQFIPCEYDKKPVSSWRNYVCSCIWRLICGWMVHTAARRFRTSSEKEKVERSMNRSKSPKPEMINMNKE